MDRELTPEEAIILLSMQAPMRCDYAQFHASRSRLFWNPQSKQNKLQYIPLDIKEKDESTRRS